MHEPTLAPVLVTPPSGVPVSVADMRGHLRLPATVADTVLEGLVQAAVAQLDAWQGDIGLCLVTQTWEWALSGFPDAPLALPLRPVRSITIDYVSPAGANLSLVSSQWLLVPAAGWHELRRNPDVVWPETASGPMVVRLRMVCGWPVGDVPADLRTAILLIAGDIWSAAARSAGLRKEVVDKVGSEEWDTSSSVTDATRRVIDRLLFRHRLPRP